GRYEQKLTCLNLADAEDRLLAPSEALTSRGLPDSLRGLGEIQIAAIYDWPALRSEFLLALAEACERAGTVLRGSLPASGSGLLDVAVGCAPAVLVKRGASLGSLGGIQWGPLAQG